MLLPQKSRRHFFFHYKEIYPYNISIESSRKVKRAKKKFNKGIISWSNTNFSEQTSWEWYRRQQGELLMRSGGERVKKKDFVFCFLFKKWRRGQGRSTVTGELQFWAYFLSIWDQTPGHVNLLHLIFCLFTFSQLLLTQCKNESKILSVKMIMLGKAG